MTELPRPFPSDRIGVGGTSITIDATPGDCAALAARMLLPSIASVSCRWSLRNAGGGAVDAEGQLRARVTQTCIVTADAFEQSVAEDFAVRFVLESRADDTDELDLDAIDELVYDGVTIDLGEATAEQFALALDPYPRRPGAELAVSDDEPGLGAFAALARLQKPS
jgi:uncharacterized metal-binding protein YceD (DUF177 family)